MTLQRKLLLALLPATALATQGTLLASRSAVRGVLEAQLEQAARAHAERAAAALAAGFSARSEGALLRELQDLQRGTGALYAAAVEPGGRVLAHTNVLEVGKNFAAPQVSEPAFDVAVPVRPAGPARDGEAFLIGGAAGDAAGAPLGHLRIGLSLLEARKTERDISRRLLNVLLPCAALAIGALLWLVRGLLSPIRRLVDGTARIRDGDYGTTVPEGTSDEVGALARSFNAMSSQLAATTVSKEFFNDVVEGIQDQLFVTDPAGRILLVNPATCGLLGYSRAELLGEPAAKLLEGGDGTFQPEGLASLEEKGGLENLEVRLVTKAGEPIPVMLSASVLRGRDGRPTGFIGAAKDVREARRMEARMRQSEKLSAVGQLAAGVAHEINNPLGVILGFSQGAARRLEPGHALELPLRSIEREALRCRNLVQELLTFARTTAREKEPVDLDAAVSEALALVETQARLAGARLSADLSGDLPRVLADKTQLQQVVLNLAKNGLDAMEPGGELTVATGLVREGGQAWVVLSVADTGPGIPPELLGRIFEPFFTTKPVGKGTGLGLSLVSEIVSKHAGTIDVDSRPGRTVFTVRLPAMDGQNIAVASLRP